MRQQALLLQRRNAVGLDFPLRRQQPFVLGVHICGVQALGDPEFQVGILALVQRFVEGFKPVEPAAIAVHLLQNSEFGLVVELLQGEQVARLVGQEGLGKFREFLQFASHGR